MGWIVAILIVALLGNLYMFSGYDVKGDVAEFMVGIAVLVDIVIVGYIIWKIYDKIKSGIEEQERQRIAEEKRIQQERIDAEKRRIDNIKNGISKIIKQYKPKEINWMPLGTSLEVPSELLNQDVVSTVKVYKQKISSLIDNCKRIDSRINEVLGCQGITDLEYKLEYLNSKTTELLSMKKESDLLHQEISKTKIRIIDNDSYAIHIMHKAFELVNDSKKCLSDKINFRDLLATNKPAELGIFTYSREPIILKLYEFYYCLFGNVILVFDNNGRFSTALDPTAIHISIKKQVADVYISNNSTTFTHKYVDSDSKKIREGQTTSRWLYTCRDGSPDMRRTHNPLIQSRTDVYEYGVVKFVINGFPLEFSISSAAALEALVLMSVEYCKKQNHLHNPTMDFVNLIKCCVAEHNIDIDEIIRISSSKQIENNYFCFITK